MQDAGQHLKCRTKTNIFNLRQIPQDIKKPRDEHMQLTCNFEDNTIIFYKTRPKNFHDNHVIDRQLYIDIWTTNDKT